MKAAFRYFGAVIARSAERDLNTHPSAVKRQVVRRLPVKP